VQRAIETLSLLALITVAALRPLVRETYDSAPSLFTEALRTVRDPSPLRTVVFDLLILGGVAGLLLARAIGASRRYRRTGLEWGAILVALAAVVSCVFAGNKRLALNGAVDWLCCPLLTIALVQLLHRPWQRRLALAAVLATACAQAFQCYEQHLVGFDETWAHYQSIKEETWSRQGVELDSARVDAFERRLRAREASGSMPHSNVAGSYLVLCGLAAVGLTIARWRRPTAGFDRLLKAGCALMTTGLLGAVVLTWSLGAIIAGVVAVILWIVVAGLGRWIKPHRATAFIVGWVCVATVGVGVVGYGLYRHALPSWSLTFRWQYWRASSKLIADHALTGVGRENYDRHYLRYKLIEAPEEVANPHNLFVQAAADWGALGLVGVVVMLVGASRVVCLTPVMRDENLAAPRGSPRGDSTARDARPADGDAHAAARDGPGAGFMLRWGVTVLILLTAGRVALIWTDDPRFFFHAYYLSMTTALCWLVGFAVFGLGWESVDEGSDRPSRSLSAGVAFGLFAFVLHDMINFAAFVPATATTVFTLLAVCVAQRSGRESRAVERTGVARWLPFGLAIGGIAIVVGAAAVPVARAGYHLGRAREMGRQIVPAAVTAQIANAEYDRAVEADPLDPTPCVEKARWLMALSQIPNLRDEAYRLAAEALAKGADRDPFSAKLPRMQMQLYLQRALSSGRSEDYVAAIDAGLRALQLYPRDPTGLAMLGDVQLVAGEATGSRQLLRDAVASYDRALRLDDQRLVWEELHRLREKDRAAIQSKRQRAEDLLSSQR